MIKRLMKTPVSLLPKMTNKKATTKMISKLISMRCTFRMEMEIETMLELSLMDRVKEYDGSSGIVS